jgi:hypothetical protein
MQTDQSPPREAVARIIDPGAWKTHDDWMKLLNDPLLSEIARGSYTRRMPVIVAPSLAKADAILALLTPAPQPATGEVKDDAAFMAAWAEMERQGYQYSDSNVEKVHLGWQMASARFERDHLTPTPQQTVTGEAITGLIERLRAAVTYQYMPMSARKLLSEAVAALALPPPTSAPLYSGAEAWDELVNKDDRTSPEEYPDMRLITRDELIAYVDALDHLTPTPQGDADRPKASSRVCDICSATVAEWPEVMCCHCGEQPWRIKP